ncbi:unnamed protein product [Symbiodinium sp. CCMP2456]|nr:unnamed protein product [Symbiodinium sp. CCMP2456]
MAPLSKHSKLKPAHHQRKKLLARKKPPPTVKQAKKQATMETNRRFKDEYQLTYSGRGQETPAQSVKLRDADMPVHSDICNLSPKTARAMLQHHGVLRGWRDRPTCHCWACGTVMEAADSESNSYWCSAGRSCTQRCGLTDATFAYTPFSRQAAAGYDPDFVLFLKTALAVSCKMSQDQTAHLTRTKDMSTRAAYEQVTRLMQAHKVAMAWSETARTAASSTRFDREIVEADSARFSKRKEVDEQGKPVRAHNGRTLVLKGRRT